jgi:hypothetical protein
MQFEAEGQPLRFNACSGALDGAIEVPVPSFSFRPHSRLLEEVHFLI